MIDLEPACRRMIDVLTSVVDEQLTSPTPCTEYTVGDLIDHVDLVSRGFAAIARNEVAEQAGTEPSAAHLGHGWQGSVAKHVQALGEAWADPASWQGKSGGAGLELPNEVWGKIAFTEIVVHGWDIAKAIGQPFDLPEETVQACFDHVAEFLPNAPIKSLWASAVEVPVDAPLLDRVVAITGRNP
jgi:uncharacterized protein (TIGR03086 family)